MYVEMGGACLATISEEVGNFIHNNATSTTGRQISLKDCQFVSP